ncbi:hypothetical protein VIGAN_04127400, partial [Vigna angularis var. angularis]
WDFYLFQHRIKRSRPITAAKGGASIGRSTLIRSSKMKEQHASSSNIPRPAAATRVQKLGLAARPGASRSNCHTRTK